MSFKFSDLHCHPVGQLMLEFSQLHEAKFDGKNAHPWNIQKSKRAPLEAGKRAGKYSQSDFARLLKGNVKLVFAALYPFEQGFLTKIVRTNSTAPLQEAIITYSETSDLLDNMDFISSRIDYDDNGKLIFDGIDDEDLKKVNSFPAFLVKMIMGIPVRKVKQIRSETYNYWTELNKEYNFLLRKSGQIHSKEIFFDTDDDGKIKKYEKVKVSGQYKVLSKDITSGKNLKWGQQSFLKHVDLDSAVDQENLVIVVPTIEGINTLSMDNQITPVSKETLFSRIEEIKSWDPKIFFITFAHHFNNNLCAHAHSISSPIPIADQSPAMNYLDNDKQKGINLLGFEVIEKLLEIQKAEHGYQPTDHVEKRILIDVKHMSASARKNYYEQIIIPFNNSHDKKIPVIASHMGYAGVKTLDLFIANYDNELKNFTPHGEADFPSQDGGDNLAYNNWNINLCDQDIQIILKSEGLIGLSFDQRILGDPGKIFQIKYKREEKIKAFFDDFAGIIKAAEAVNLHIYNPEHYSVWDALCIGTDNDGFIDPIDDHATAADFPEFGKDFKKLIEQWEKRADYGIGTNETLNAVLEKFTFLNAFEFLKKHY
jgi:hypothetical protein